MSYYRKIIAVLCCFIICYSLFASDYTELKVSLIPKELLKNAKAVIRQNDIVIDVNNDDAFEKHTLDITILNKNGYDLSVFHEFYDAFTRISGISIKIIDSEGKKIKSYWGDDIIDHSAINGYSLYEDNRVKYFDPQYRKYPFTIEFTFKRKLKSLMFLPYWQVYPDYNCAIEKSSLTVNISDDSKIRYYEKNMPQPCSIEEKEKTKILKWTITNLPAFSQEDFEESLLDYTPVVFLAPEEFEVDGIKGNLKSWKDFGKWIIELNKDRDTLSAATIKTLQDITQGLTTKEKIQKIYEYMQKRTRYVSIQVGIGGWQPFDALTVDRLAYGDCKALANYTYALLKSVGIQANYMLITAGKNASNIIVDFPSQFFNHAILSVPLEKDTIFLECTSPYLPYGHIGSFTDNRYALAITKDRGVLIKTRLYTPEENIISSKSIITIDIEGNGTAIVKTSYEGCNFDEAKYLSVQTNEDIKKQLYKKMNISNFIIADYSFNQPDKNLPVINESVNLNLDRYATIMNKKLIIPLNFKSKIMEIPDITEQRKSDIVIRRPQTIIDTVEYIIPSNCTIEKVPNECKINSEFAQYNSKCSLTSKDRIIYYRKLILLPGRFAPAEAQKFKDFYTKVSQADMLKVTLVKK